MFRTKHNTKDFITDLHLQKLLQTDCVWQVKHPFFNQQTEKSLETGKIQLLSFISLALPTQDILFYKVFTFCSFKRLSMPISYMQTMFGKYCLVRSRLRIYLNIYFK